MQSMFSFVPFEFVGLISGQNAPRVLPTQLRDDSGESLNLTRGREARAKTAREWKDKVAARYRTDRVHTQPPRTAGLHSELPVNSDQATGQNASHPVSQSSAAK